jgi:hypothetical protein
VAALNYSSHSGKVTRAQLARTRVAMLQDVGRQISAELRRVPGLPSAPKGETMKGERR